LQWTSDDVGVTWRMVASQPFPPRSDFAMVVLGSTLFVIGGEFGPPTVYGDVWSSDDGGVTWGQVTALTNFPPRFQHAACTVGNTIVVLGGRVCTGQTFATCQAVGDMWISQNQGIMWSQTSAHAQYVNVCFLHICLFLGRSWSSSCSA
jgi:hypothetical protein